MAQNTQNATPFDPFNPAAQPGGAPQTNFDPLNCRGLYIGNLDVKVTDALLYEIFSTIGPIEGCKVIKDKNGNSAGYGFVDYYDHLTADRALQNLNGRKIYSSEIKVNWAYAGGQREDSTAGHFHIFVGDLSPEIDDKALYLAFLAFGSCSDARVMWDQNTGRSRGYGFVAFRKKEDAERALTGMNGEWLGNRAVRCNWANQKVSSNTGTDPTNSDYATILNQAPFTNCTVYVGNIATDVADEHLIKTIFEEYGVIEEIRLQKEKGYAFIRFQTHDQSAKAISAVHGRAIGNKTVKCSWGKERAGGSGYSTMTPPQYNGGGGGYGGGGQMGGNQMGIQQQPPYGYYPPPQQNPYYPPPNAPYGMNYPGGGGGYGQQQYGGHYDYSGNPLQN